MTETMIPTPRTTRPMVDFSGSSRATAREYAAAANSRVLEESSQKVLRSASQGRMVDAYALNAAITDAMRSCSTRLGQSMARRDLNRKVAYLGHICQAVLENHADGLPVYEPGQRSRLVEELRLEVEHAGVVNQSLTRDLSAERERTAALIREKTQAEVAFDDLKKAANAEIDRIGAAVNHNLEVATEALADRDTLGAVLCYALEHLDAEARQRVFGYWDGVQS